MREKKKGWEASVLEVMSHLQPKEGADDETRTAVSIWT